VIVPASLFEVLLQVPQAMQARQLVRESSERIEGLLGEELPAEIPADTGEAVLEVRALGEQGSPLIELSDLSVTYPGKTQPAVTDVTLTLEPGEMLLVTGESGAGKSTLAKALVRFIEYEGSYTLAGVEARE